MNKLYFCQNFFVIDWHQKRVKNTIDLFLFYGENFYGFSESDSGFLACNFIEKRLQHIIFLWILWNFKKDQFWRTSANGCFCIIRKCFQRTLAQTLISLFILFTSHSDCLQILAEGTFDETKMITVWKVVKSVKNEQKCFLSS